MYSTPEKRYQPDKLLKTRRRRNRKRQGRRHRTKNNTGRLTVDWIKKTQGDDMQQIRSKTDVDDRCTYRI